MKRIKVFLVACANCTTPQEINCDAISRHLDKKKFDVSILLYIFNINSLFKEDKDVEYLRLKRPVSLIQPLLILWGVLKCDVVYNPVGIMPSWTKFCIRLFGKKAFNTVEGLLDDEALLKVQDVPSYIAGYRWYEPNLYAISKCVKSAVENNHGMKCAERILYLGTEMSEFYNTKNNDAKVQNVIFIGRETIRKRLTEFLEMALHFPDLKFHIAGGNRTGNGTIEDWIKTNHCTNVIYHGEVDRKNLTLLLKEMDVLFFPSRSEGFGKVTFECAASGVVPIVYSDYGAGDWIDTGKNGFVVDTFGQAVEALKKMNNDQDLFIELSHNASKLGLAWDWNTIIHEWEKEIESIVRNK